MGGGGVGGKPTSDENILYSMNRNEHCVCCKENAKPFIFHYGNSLLRLDYPVPV